jgi:hypothetical protein
MKEAIVAGVLFAISLSWIARVAKKPGGFVRHFSRGAFMRDLNERLKATPFNSHTDEK